MKEGLRPFLIEANKAGYAAGDKPVKRKEVVKEPDGSTTIIYKSESGEWKMLDHFFGGEPYAGQIVLYHNGKDYWSSVYYGSVNPSYGDVEGLYTFLQEALSSPPKEWPIRGPKRFENGSLVYTTEWEGTLEKFFQKEKIEENGTQIYDATFIGGLVNQRGEE